MAIAATVTKCILLEFAPIMPAFCSLLLASYFSKNYASKIGASLNEAQQKQTCQHLAVVYWQLVSLLMQLSIDSENCSLAWCA